MFSFECFCYKLFSILESFSFSSSNESDDSVIDSTKNGSGESLTVIGELAIFDENVIPEGCDPKLYDLTFKLRSQRHEIEQNIEMFKKKIMSLNTNLVSANAELDITINEMKRNRNELKAYKVGFLLTHYN